MPFEYTVITESTIRLIEEGCLKAHTVQGDEVCALDLREMLDKYNALPCNLLVTITEKGRDALARGRP